MNGREKDGGGEERWTDRLQELLSVTERVCAAISKGDSSGALVPYLQGEISTLVNDICTMEEANYERAQQAEHQVDRLEGELAEARDQLGQCYRLSGADPDGDDNQHLARHAVQAVGELREESDANCNEELELREKAEQSLTQLREALGEEVRVQRDLEAEARAEAKTCREARDWPGYGEAQGERRAHRIAADRLAALATEEER